MWRCDSLSSFPGDCSQILSSPGGLEPPTFRLTAERANQLRHGDMKSVESQIFEQPRSQFPGNKGMD